MNDYGIIMIGLVKEDDIILTFYPNHPRHAVKLEEPDNTVILHLEHDVEGGTPHAGDVLDTRLKLSGKETAYPLKMTNDGMYIGYTFPMFYNRKELAELLKENTKLRVVYEKV